MCRKKTKNLKSKIIKTKNGRLIMQSKCADCGIKKSRFVKEQEEKGLLTNLRVKTLLNKIFIVKCFVLRCIKTNEINEIVNNFLLVGDKSFKTTWFYLQCLWTQGKSWKVYAD